MPRASIRWSIAAIMAATCVTGCEGSPEDRQLSSAPQYRLFTPEKVAEPQTNAPRDKSTEEFGHDLTKGLVAWSQFGARHWFTNY